MSRSGGLADNRRLLRFSASAVLAGSLAAMVLQLDSVGPGRWLAALAAIAALWLVLRHARPLGSGPGRAGAVHAAGRVMLLAGLALMLAVLAVSRGGEQRARIAALCPGQSAQLGAWNLKLAGISPVAGEGFTALEAAFSASREAGSALVLEPQLRSYFMAGPKANAASRAQLWTGDLALEFPRFDAGTGCLGLDASWRPFALWGCLGGWLAALGAALLTLIALGSIRWRAAARKRIAMRREDRPLPGGRPAGPTAGLSWLVPGLVLAIVLAGLAALFWPGPSAEPAAPPFARGSALVAARQSLLQGPANTNRWIVIADAMARRGHYADAAELLLGAVEADPRDPDGWLALGDALYGHAGGHLSVAATLAYDRADRAALAQGAPLPPAGLAMERSRRGELAQMWWRRQLAGPAANAGWQAAIEARLNESPP